MIEKDNIDNQIEEAYEFLKDVSNLDIMISGNYTSALLSIRSIKNNVENLDIVIDKTFWKFINELSKHITEDDRSFIMYKSYCSNEPSEELIEDCFKIVNNELFNKKNSKEPTIYNLLEEIKNKYDETEIEKSLDTIFDILLDYYNIIRK